MLAALAPLKLSSLDLGIVLCYLAASVIIGLWANRVTTGLRGYLVAGHSLGTALSVATMTGSELGLITVMYQAQKGFTGGFAALHIGVIAGLVAALVGLTGFIVVPLRRAGVMTIPEYYEQRFGRKTRVLGGTLLAVGGLLNMGLFLRIGSQFVVAVTGLDPSGGILPLVMTGLLLLVLVYTVLGGMVSVVLTDYIQFVVLSVGLLLTAYLLLQQFGLDTLFATVDTHMGAAGLDPTVGEVGFGPGYISWMAVLGLVSVAIWPTAVTRALSARDEGVVRRQYLLSSIGFLVRFMLPCLLGICALTWLMHQPDATLLTTAGGDLVPAGAGDPVTHFQLAGGRVHENIEAFPAMLPDILPIGLLGIVCASMLAALMSTHDSYLLCWASVIAHDVIAPVRAAKGHPLTEAKQLLLTRILIVVVGLWVLVWGVFYRPSQDVWDYIGITGAVYFTGAIAVLIGGIYWRRASATGAVAALLAGLTAVLGLGPIQRALGFEQPIASWAVGLATLALCGAAMVVGSLIAPDPEHQGHGDTRI